MTNQKHKLKRCPFGTLSLGYGICTSRATLIESVQNHGELRLALSRTAVKLYKDGTPLAFVLTRVGIRYAFASEINSKSVWVTLRVKNGKLSITKA